MNKPKERIIWTPIIPVPETAPEPPSKFRNKKISHYYKYYSKHNELIGYTVLIRLADGGKEVVPVTYCRSNRDGEEWRFKSFEKPRPPYGVDKWVDKPYAQILLVEGEKCADAANKLFKDVKNLVALSWIGGFQGVKYVDWKLLKGRKIIFWPDADTQRYPDIHKKAGELKPFVEQPGIDAMIKIYGLTKKNIIEGRLLKPPPDKINGWDIADAITDGWSVEKILEFIKKNLVCFEDISLKPDAKIMNGLKRPFQCLGYNSYNGSITYYYLPVGTGKITALTASAHNKMSLLSLAPIQYYEREYPKAATADFTAAANDCIRHCENIGVYDPLRVRGRGAWYDDGRTVLHMGNKLIVDGRQRKIDDMKSYYIYEAEIPTEADADFMSEILTPKEARNFVEICEFFSWENNISSKLFAGWVFLAPICGAIEWRPHVWVTGESSTGKSWIQDNIVTQVLGKSVLNVASNSTEAGIRQVLKSDAIPVIFDEIETEDKDSFFRVQHIIELARASSSNKASSIVKGTISGHAQCFCMRSCFMFSSINPKLIQQADESRITILKLIRRPDYETGNMFDMLRDKVVDTLTDAYCVKLRARAIKLIPIIRNNIDVFSSAMAKILRSKRDGDQIGALLAGAYGLVSDKVITKEAAEDYCKSIDWEKEADISEKPDQEKIIDVILQQLIRIDGSSNTEAVGSLLRKAGREYPPDADLETENDIDMDRIKARDNLRKYGITTTKRKIGGYNIAFAVNHTLLMRLLDGTPWSNGYKLVLNRHKGSKLSTAVFADRVRSQAIIIPFEDIFTEEIEEDEEIKKF